MINKKKYFIIFAMAFLSQSVLFTMENDQIVDEKQWEERWSKEVHSFQENYHLKRFNLIRLYKKAFFSKYGPTEESPSKTTTSNYSSIDHQKLMEALLYKKYIEALSYNSYINLYDCYLKLNSLYRLYKTDLYQKFNLNCRRKLLTGPAVTLSYSLPSPSMWDSLKQLFFTSTSSPHITLDSIKSDLTQLIDYLKKNNIENDKWQQEDITNKYKQLWSHYLSLHNYTSLDKIMYPSHPAIDDNEEAQYRRKQLLLIHPDKDKSNVNAIQKNELFTTLTDISRPTKPLDPIIDGFSFTGSIGAYRTGMQAIGTISSLPSILFPQYFTNKTIASYRKGTAQENLETKQYKNVSTKHINYIQQHETAIKRKECSIRKKQEHIRNDLVKIFSTKKSKH
jgi:hypothetical protein